MQPSDSQSTPPAKKPGFWAKLFGKKKEEPAMPPTSDNSQTPQPNLDNTPAPDAGVPPVPGADAPAAPAPDAGAPAPAPEDPNKQV